MKPHIKSFFFLLFLYCSLYSCTQEKFSPIKGNFIENIDSLPKYKKTKDWYLKDILKDTIAGISLERAHNSILKNKEGIQVVIGLLDSNVDINHSDFNGQIWINANEIEGNGIDDDGNNYVDDIYGWNFLRNKNGESVVIENYEYVRVVRELEDKMTNTQIDTLSKEYKIYSRSKKKMERKLISAERSYKRVNKMMAFYYEAREALKEYFPDNKYSLDVLNKIDTTNNDLSKYVEEIRSVIEYNDTDDNMVRNHKRYRDNFEKKININYFPRKLLGDNPYDIEDTEYGSNVVSDNLDVYTHGTRITGMLTRTCPDCKDKESIKVMPIPIVPDGGSTQDKDIALGIRYAVNNGARVINMSFGKSYSFHNEWVIEAMKYAEENNVLLIAAAGNANKNIDGYEYVYPNDKYESQPEFCDNFLYVSATSYNIDASIVPYGDYGKETVDIFAPGEEIYTTFPNDKFEYDSGTSLAAALTSKVAALIFSYYPDLTASEVKHIIMDSGVEFTFPVKTPTKEDKEKMTPFNELSKSGKIVNAYNALIMADSVSKKK